MKHLKASLAVIVGLSLLPLGAFAQDSDTPEGKRPPHGEMQKDGEGKRPPRGEKRKDDDGKRPPRGEKRKDDDGKRPPRDGKPGERPEDGRGRQAPE